MLQAPRQAESDAGDNEESHGAHDGRPGGEIVDADEGVSALADPADGGVCDGGAEDANEGDTDGGEALGGGYVL